MSTAMKIITDPSLEPVTLAEAVAYARGNIGIEDDLFDDLIACAEWLIESRYTCTEKLSIEGGEQWWTPCRSMFGSAA